VELLLNLAWLLLALPAFWLWRDSRSAASGRKFTAFQCLLTLGCMLVILFPVVSATDDLQAMRAEMEESATSKRSIGQSSGEKSSASRTQPQPALALTSSFCLLTDQGWHRVIVPAVSSVSAPRIFRASRAPPRSLIA